MKNSKINNNDKITLRRSNRITKKTQENDTTVTTTINDTKLQDKRKKRKVLGEKNHENNDEILSEDNSNLSHEKSHSTLFSETPMNVLMKIIKLQKVQHRALSKKSKINLF